MRYLIIGLGIYGSNLALDLTKMGHEVIGADKRPELVEAIKENISTAYIVDSTDEMALNMLPLKNVDVVIVAIGENFGASVRTVALLKKNGVKHIFARAIDKIHESILQSFDIERIVKPEQRAAKDLANEMALATEVSSIAIAHDSYVLNFKAPEVFVGTHYVDLSSLNKQGLRLIAASRDLQSKNILGMVTREKTLLDITNPNLTVQPGDYFCCLGTSKAYNDLFRNIDR